MVPRLVVRGIGREFGDSHDYILLAGNKFRHQGGVEEY